MSNEEKKLSRSRKSLVIRLCRYLFVHKRLMLTAFVLMTASNLLALAGPALSGYAIDAISRETGVDFDGVFVNCALMLIVYVLSSVLSYLLTVVMSSVSKKVT